LPAALPRRRFLYPTRYHGAPIDCRKIYPHAEVARKFGTLREGDPVPGISDRAIFIVGKDGTIKFAQTYPLDQVPDNQELFAALEELKSTNVS